MSKILIAYSSTDGHTISICKRLAEIIEIQSHSVNILPISALQKSNLADWDKVVIGASIRYGKHQTELYRFIQTNKVILENKHSTFFTVNVVARKSNKNCPETNPYMRKFLEISHWRPSLLGVFAGKVDYQQYNWFNRQMIRLIMWKTNGPTDLHSVTDFTDWQRVEQFGHEIAASSR